jgi:hypothetical protein
MNRRHVLLGAMVGLVSLANATTALIVDDGTTFDVNTVESFLSGRLVNAGYSVTTNNGIPGGSLASYATVWDIRYQNNTPLTNSDITTYLAYLTGGGSLFVIGENSSYITRDNSFIPLFTAVGGGAVAIAQVANSLDLQTVQAPFTGPVTLPTVTFVAIGAFTSFGNARPISVDSNGAAGGIVFPPGTMTNAPAGTLISVLDVDFVSADAGSSQALTDNLIAYLGPVPIAPPPSAAGAPALGEWGLIGLAGLLLTYGAFRIKRSSQAG